MGDHAEVLSGSHDSLDSTEVPADGASEVDELSEADSDASAVVRRSLWDVATSEEHMRTHRPALPIHCHSCMAAKAKRKRRASRRGSTVAKRFDSMTRDHVFMKDWLCCKGVDGFLTAPMCMTLLLPVCIVSWSAIRTL